MDAVWRWWIIDADIDRTDRNEIVRRRFVSVRPLLGVVGSEGVATDEKDSSEEELPFSGIVTDIGLAATSTEGMVEVELDLFLEEGTDSEKGLGLCNLLGPALGVMVVVDVGALLSPVWVTIFSLSSCLIKSPPVSSSPFIPFSLASFVCDAEDVGSEKNLVITGSKESKTGTTTAQC